MGKRLSGLSGNGYLFINSGIQMVMQELDDVTLLRRYTEQNSEEAFAALVRRHVDKVYSVALRHTRNPHQAEEVTQAVFIILAKKARHLGKGVIVSGWLYQTARLTAVTFIRSEIRRARREEESCMRRMLNETDSDSDVWPRVEPLVDAAMASLNETDRHAIVLRFFDGKSMREVGLALGASEDAAKMRLNRAVEKLRGFLSKRGVVLPAAVLTAAISAHSVQAAPAVLAQSITAAAMTKGVAAGGSTLTLIKGTLKVMAWTKLKTAVAVSAIAILAIGTATATIRHSKPATETAATLAFAGYATPEATIQSSIWAGSTGNFSRFLEGCTPDQAARFRNKMAGKSESEVRQAAIGWAKALTGYKITRKEVIADDEVHLHISAPPSAEGLRSGKVTVILKKLGGAWRQDGDL